MEWPQDAHAELAQARVRVSLSHSGGDRRRIEVDGLGAAGREGAPR